MKGFVKYFYIVILIVAALPLFYLFGKVTDNRDNLWFQIRLDSDYVYKIDAYERRKEFYLFIPGNVDRENVELSSAELKVDGKSMHAGDSVKDISLNDRHEIEYKNRKYNFYIIQGSQVSSLYLNTATGSMNEVYTDKNHREPVSLMAYNENGELDYLDNTAYIKGHGNSTWSWNGKKPFTLSFDQEISLLGLTKGQKVVLLANAGDYTATKNKTAMLLSERLGLEWTPSAEYTELYVDGEYLGLYLACDKVECTDEKLSLDPSSDYLIQSTNRTHAGDVLFYTHSGQYFLVDYGDTSIKGVENLTEVIKDIDDDIMGGVEPEKLDMDTFARKYLLEQIAYNTDVHSLYFYLKNGKLFSGPAWDYDLAARNLESYENVVGFKRFRWYDKALKNDYIKEYIENLYDSEVQDIAYQFVDDVIAIENAIRESNKMDLIRWDRLYIDLEKEYSQLNDNYLRHIEYLKKAYLQNSDGYVLRITGRHPDVDFLYFSDGNGLLSLPEDCPLMQGAKGYKVEDGSEFDYSRPMTEDVEIYCSE